MRGARRAACLAFSLSKSLCSPNKYQTHTHTQGNRAGTLTDVEQNRPFSREHNHRGEEPCGAYWYSLQLISADANGLAARSSHRETEGEPERGRARATGSTSLIVVQKADPISSPPPSPLICIPQLPLRPLSPVAQLSVKRPDISQRKQNKKGGLGRLKKKQREEFAVRVYPE